MRCSFALIRAKHLVLSLFGTHCRYSSVFSVKLLYEQWTDYYNRMVLLHKGMYKKLQTIGFELLWLEHKRQILSMYVCCRGRVMMVIWTMQLWGLPPNKVCSTLPYFAVFVSLLVLSTLNSSIMSTSHHIRLLIGQTPWVLVRCVRHSALPRSFTCCDVLQPGLFDSLLRSAIQRVTNSELSDAQWLHSSLPVRDAGLAITCLLGFHCEHSPSARRHLA